MNTKIYMVTMTSYTTSDDNLYNNTWTYNDEEEARQQYISLRDEQSEECRWGADYDNSDHTNDFEYNMSEREDGNTYEASSEAYEGYKVCVKLEAVEIEIPVFAVTYASHTREDYDDYLHMDDPQIFTSRSEAREEYEGMKRYAENTAANEYDDAGDGKRYRPEISTDEDDEGNEIAATISRTDNPLSIYTGRVELHTL